MPAQTPELSLAPLPSHDLTVAELSAQAAIVDCINRLFIATDRRDWEAARACLADRIHLDMSSVGAGAPGVVDASDVVGGWKTGLAGVEQIHHQAGNYRVHLRGDEATAFCYGTATHYRKTKSGRNVRTFVGSYDLELRRSGAWRITGFRFTLKYLDGNLELEKD